MLASLHQSLTKNQMQIEILVFRLVLLFKSPFFLQCLTIYHNLAKKR